MNPLPAARDDDSVSPALRLLGERRRGSLLAGAALCIATLGCLGAVLVQRIPTGVEVAGVLWPEGGVSRLGAPREGRLEKMLVKPGDLVDARQPLMVVRHRLVPAVEMAAMQKREEMLKARLDEVQAAIAVRRPAFGSTQSVALVRLEDELSASLVALRDQVAALRNESTTVLYAPRAGRIAEIRASEGGEVNPQQALATIVTDGAAYHARAYVPADVAARLTVGSPARIRHAAGADRGGVPRAGRVRAISSLPVAPRDVDRSIVIREPMYEIEIAFVDAAPVGVVAGPGAPVGVAFEFDHVTLLVGMFGRFASP